MIQVKLSEIGSAEVFATAIEVHRLAVEKHMLGKPGIGAPRSSELIEGLIKRVPGTGPVGERGPDTITIAEYVVIDDTPPPLPAPTLQELRLQKLFEAHAAGEAAKAAIMSPARAQLLMMDSYAAIAVPEDARTPLQCAAIENHTAVLSRFADIDRAVVLAQIEIEDLTDLTISGWNPPKF